jgi:photosystem II stability/assembly factor-like uncharacterized protein
MVSAQGWKRLFAARVNMKSFWRRTVVLALLCSAGCNHSVTLESTPQFQSAAFYWDNRAWLVTRKGDLLRTFDAGKSWQTMEFEIWVNRLRNLSTRKEDG